jgi:hypothetical protein
MFPILNTNYPPLAYAFAAGKINEECGIYYIKNNGRAELFSEINKQGLHILVT